MKLEAHHRLGKKMATDLAAVQAGRVFTRTNKNNARWYLLLLAPKQMPYVSVQKAPVYGHSYNRLVSRGYIKKAHAKPCLWLPWTLTKLGEALINRNHENSTKPKQAASKQANRTKGRRTAAKAAKAAKKQPKKKGKAGRLLRKNTNN